MLWILGALLGLIIIVGIVIFIANRQPAAPTLGQVVNQQASSASSANQADQAAAAAAAQNSAQAPASTTQKSSTGIHKITDSQAIAPALSYDGQSMWYFTADGHLYKINLQTGLKQEFILPQKVSIVDAIWPSNGDNFVVASGSAGNQLFYYYDGAARQFIAYPSNIKGLDFMPNGSQVAYNWASGLTSEFSIADKTTKNHQTIVNLPVQGLTIKVSPLGNQAFAYDAANPQNGKLYYILVDSKKIITLPTALDDTALWSPDGKYFVYNRNSAAVGAAKTGELWLGSSSEAKDTDLHIAAAVSKVVFDKSASSIYVVAPTLDGLSEEVWKIDLLTLDKTKVFKPADTDAPIKANNLILSSDGSTLYYKNSDGYVYSLPLSQ